MCGYRNAGNKKVAGIKEVTLNSATFIALANEIS